MTLPFENRCCFDLIRHKMKFFVVCGYGSEIFNSIEIRRIGKINHKWEIRHQTQWFHHASFFAQNQLIIHGGVNSLNMDCDIKNDAFSLNL